MFWEGALPTELPGQLSWLSRMYMGFNEGDLVVLYMNSHYDTLRGREEGEEGGGGERR